MVTQRRIRSGELEGQAGPYQLVQPLGEGGMGVVYRARHRDTGAWVALKVVRLNEESMLATFRREIFAMRCIDHPQVVRIVDDGIDRGNPWYAMELLEGRTLADHIDDLFSTATMPPLVSRSRALETVDSAALTTPLPDVNAATVAPPGEAAPRRAAVGLAETLAIVEALCAPLAYVHGAGIVHRDLKPDNILLRDDGTPLLVDFGLALYFGGGEGRRDVLDAAGRALGTPPYMAPEQIRGDLVDARADLYALGCMLFECVTGRAPFQGTPVEVMQQHLADPPPRPSSLREGVPPEVDVLIARLLQKRPRDRIGYAADVAAALRDIGTTRQRVVSAPTARPYLYRPALAGRRAVLDELEPWLQKRDDALGGCVFIGGESGVGKTRLAMELATWAARRGANVVTGQCLDTRVDGGGISVKAAPLYPVRPVLHAIADRCRTGGVAETDRILGDRGPVLAPYAPRLADLPGQLQQQPPAELSADASRFRLLDALATSIALTGVAQPLFVVIDDLQWADELTLAWLRHLDHAYFAASNVFIVGTYRNDEMTPELRAVLDGQHGVELGLLDRAAVAEMVGDMLALEAPPNALVDFLMTESEGNPFFIAEYLRTAIGESVLRRSVTGAWVVGSRAQSTEMLREALPLPGGLRELVTRRLDGLDDDARALVDVAAVIGREIDGDVLVAASSLAERARSALQTLRARQVLEEDDKGGLRFVHDKVREVVYSTLDGARKPPLHLAVARAIEQRGASLSLQYGVLAHHLARGGDHRRAVDYLDRAGALALSSAASTEARRLFQTAHALEDEHRLAPDPMVRAQRDRRLGEAHYNLGELADAKRCLLSSLRVLHPAPALTLPFVDEGVITTAAAVVAQVKTLIGVTRATHESAGTRTRMREAALAAERLSQVHYFLNEQNSAFGAALRCAQLAERLGPSAELARAYATLSVAMNFVPIPGLMDRYGEAAERIARQAADRQANGFVAFLRGLNACGTGQWRVAARHLESALGMALETGDVRAAQEIRTLLIDAHTFRGQCADAFRHADRLRESVERTRNQQAQAWVDGSVGVAYLMLGRSRDSLAFFDAVSACTDETGDATARLVETFRAIAYLMAGDWDEAQRVADEARALSGPPPSAWHCCQGYMGAAEVYLALWERALVQGRALDELPKRATDAVVVLERGARMFPWARSAALRMRGQHQWLAGRQRRAQRSWTQALETARAMEMPFDEARAHYEIARHGGAEQHARSARRIYTRLDATRWVELTAELPACWS